MLLYRIFNIVDALLNIVRIAILVYCVLSWFRPNNRAFDYLERLVEPFIAPFRGLNRRIMRRAQVPLDFSCWFALIGISLARRLLWLLYRLL